MLSTARKNAREPSLQAHISSKTVLKCSDLNAFIDIPDLVFIFKVESIFVKVFEIQLLKEEASPEELACVRSLLLGSIMYTSNAH
jgi:hypothetical protein